jgi:hypothetical protein
LNLKRLFSVFQYNYSFGGDTIFEQVGYVTTVDFDKNIFKIHYFTKEKKSLYIEATDSFKVISNSKNIYTFRLKYEPQKDTVHFLTPRDSVLFNKYAEQY